MTVSPDELVDDFDPTDLRSSAGTAHGSAVAVKKKGLVESSQPGFGTLIGPVGGRTPVCRA